LSFLDKLFKKKNRGKNRRGWYRIAVDENNPGKKIKYFDKVLELKPGFAWGLEP